MKTEHIALQSEQSGDRDSRGNRGDDCNSRTVDSNRDAGGVREFGGPSGPEPTRYGDWERKGRCIDF